MTGASNMSRTNSRSTSSRSHKKFRARRKLRCAATGDGLLQIHRSHRLDHPQYSLLNTPHYPMTAVGMLCASVIHMFLRTRGHSPWRYR